MVAAYFSASRSLDAVLWNAGCAYPLVRVYDYMRPPGFDYRIHILRFVCAHVDPVAVYISASGVLSSASSDAVRVYYRDNDYYTSFGQIVPEARPEPAAKSDY